MDTNELIASLSGESSPPRPFLPSLTRNIGALSLIVCVYAGLIQWHLGLRPDIGAALMRPLYAAEISLLALLAMTSLAGAIGAMYPDQYDKPLLPKLPYASAALLCGFLGLRWLLGVQPGEIYPPAEDMHGMECALCIASVALIPSGLMLCWQRRGASVHPFHAGATAVLAATAIGCLTLRLAEANDSLSHLVTWHYVPTLLFAMIGAWCGKWLLKW